MRKADSLPPSCAIVTKSGNLNFLEPSGRAQDCNGTALPLPLPTFEHSCKKKKNNKIVQQEKNKLFLFVTADHDVLGRTIHAYYFEVPGMKCCLQTDSFQWVSSISPEQFWGSRALHSSGMLHDIG